MTDAQQDAGSRFQAAVEDETRRVDEAPRRKLNHPKGFEPGVQVSGDTGFISTAKDVPIEPTSNEWTELLAIWGLDPEVYEVDPDVNPEFRAWDGNVGRDSDGEVHVERFYYYKARVRLKSKWFGLDIDELLKGIDKYKRPKQALKTLSDPVGLVIPLSDWQLGKALADDTPMFTPSGWTTHGALRPGDFVYGADGLPKEILAVTGSTIQPCYRVNFDRGVTIVASGDHQWDGWTTVRTRLDGGKYRDDRLPCRMTTSEIASLRRYKNSRGKWVTNKSFHVDVAESIEGAAVDLPVDPYLFGVWLGDGARHANRFTTAVADLPHWEGQFGDALLPPYRTEAKPNTADVTVTGLRGPLVEMGALHTKLIPDAYLTASPDQRLAFLQGLLDTDGSINDNGGVDFSSSEKHIADAVAHLATSLGMKVSRSGAFATLNGVRKRWSFRVRFTPDGNNKLHHVFRMERKASKIRSFDNHQTHYRFVQNVMPVGLRSAQCITVEGALYLAGKDMVVTHNCDYDGVKGTIDRIQKAKDAALDYYKHLVKSGVNIECVYLVGMGDIVENCAGHYPSQTFGVELNRREQVRLARRLIKEWVVTFAKVAPHVVVACVGGNHGENRNGDKKAFTTTGDNDDVAVFEMVAEALMENPDAFGHVNFCIPEERLSLVLDIYGVDVGFNHGHLAGRGADPQAKLKNWLKDMAFSKQPIGDARIVVTGHYHHTQVVDHGPITWIQAPAMDGGSWWWENATGSRSTPGTLAFCVSDQYPMGFDWFKVLGFTPPPQPE